MFRKRFVNMRWLLLGTALIAAVAFGGAALAQSSNGFDLACRGTLSTAGGVSLLPGNNLELVGSMGQPIAGVSQSSSWGLYGGYVQPGSGGAVASTATVSAAAPQGTQLENATSTLFLPSVVGPISRYVRPCNW